MFLQSVLCFSTIIWVLIYIIKSTYKPKNFPPGPPRLPVWGSYWYMLKENYQMTHIAFLKLSRKFKTDLLGVYLGDFPCVIAMNYELSKEVLNRDEFNGRSDSIIIRDRSMGELKGIFFTDGEFWKQQRRFSLRHMRDYGFGRRSQNVEDFVSAEVRSLIELCNKQPDNSSNNVCRRKGEILFPEALYPTLVNSIMLIMASSTFDTKLTVKVSQAGLGFVQNIDGTGSAVSFTPWLRFIAPGFFGYTPAMSHNDELLYFVREVVDEHIATFSKDHLRDYIDVFLNENWIRHGSDWSKLDYKQLVMTVVDYLFAPPVATGQTLTFFFVYMVNHPDVQEKIQQEIDNVVGRGRLPSLDDRKSLQYTEATIREVIRILPLNPIGITRRCTQDTTLGGYFIPKDCIVAACIWTAHRDTKVWTNPEEFNPDRFIDSDGHLLKKDLTIGFGNGKRLCAGETFARHIMFQLITGVLQNYTIQSTDGQRINIMNRLKSGFALSVDSTWFRFLPR